MDVVSTWGEVAGAVYSRRQSLVTREVQDYPHLQPLPPATLTALVPAGRASGKHNTTSGKHASGKHKAARGRPGGRVCQDPSCQQVATFGHPAGGGPVNCRAHKALDDELVRGWNPCQSAEGCTRKAVFGFRSGRYTLSPISSRLLSSPPLSSPLLSCTPCQASPLLCTLSRVPLSLHPVTRLSSSLLLLSSSPCLACDWSVLCVGLYCIGCLYCLPCTVCLVLSAFCCLCFCAAFALRPLSLALVSAPRYYTLSSLPPWVANVPSDCVCCSDCVCWLQQRIVSPLCLTPWWIVSCSVVQGDGVSLLSVSCLYWVFASRCRVCV